MTIITFIILLVLLCIGYLISHQQNNKPLLGIDILGLAKHRSGSFSQVSRNTEVVGVLWGSFGDVRNNLGEILSEGHVKTVRIHVADGTCIRNKLCDKRAIQYTDYSKFIKRVKEIREFMDNFPDVTVYISPYLEHDETRRKVVRKWYMIISNYYPSAKLVCNAFKGWCPKKYMREKHGCVKGGDLISLDGSDKVCRNIIQNNRSAKMVLHWIPANNCRDNISLSNFIFPSKRDESKCTTSKQFSKQIRDLFRWPK